MMYTATYETVLLTAILAIRTIRRQHLSHTQRDQRMDALQRVLWRQMEIHGREWQQRAVLRAAYELLMPGCGHETHTDVKARLRLAEEMCTQAMDEGFSDYLPTPRIDPAANAGEIGENLLKKDGPGGCGIRRNYEWGALPVPDGDEPSSSDDIPF